MKQLLFVSLLFCLISPVFAAEYDRIITDMNNLINNYPGLVESFNIGTNDQGKVIYGIRIEDTMVFSRESLKPAHVIVGAHHGNERSSADVCIKFAQKLALAMQSDEKGALNQCVFYIVPVLNISGFNSNTRTENGYDPNRDYKDPCVTETYGKLASTRALANFVRDQNIIGGVTAHGYIGTFTYPWGIYTSVPKTTDDAQFKSMATAAVKANGYRTGTHTDVIYPASGSFEDWAYAEYGIWMTLLELGYSANLDKDAQCLLNYMALVPAARSVNHTHNPNNCTSSRGTDSRP